MKAMMAALCASPASHAGLGLLTSLAWLNLAHAQTRVFSVREVGAGPTPSVELEFPFPLTIFSGLQSLTSPSGEVFTRDSALESRPLGALLKAFSSLESAFDYMAGTWHGFVEGGHFDDDINFEFEVALIPTDSVNRSFPENLSIGPGDKVRNGQTFLMSWDFASDAPPHRAYAQLQRKSATGSAGGLQFLDVPEEGSNTQVGRSIGVGENGFTYAFESEPGTTEHRWLTTLSTSTALPFDMEISVGAMTDLNSAVTNNDPGVPDPFDNYPTIGLHYHRVTDAFPIQIVIVPEPSTKVLAAILGPGLVSLGVRRTWCTGLPLR
jgi:hypothetical protein